MFQGVYGKKRVLVTGFSGFKGACLSRFLHRLGAELFGVALPMPEPSLWSISGGERILQGEYCDIRNLEKLEKIFSKFRPEIVFHLAARS
ncbi:MAG: NAD-dependent epimerase/dehydratase family protein, partial [Lentisphaeria bacterium]|nr:NAD-dependent epimerase/dehydratase family protein [Lentisphaeria bacterium]